MKKIKAITMIELLLVMILSSFTIGVGYYIIELLNKQSGTFIKERRQLQLNRELRYFLYHDVSECNYLISEKDSVVKMLNPDTITYTFSHNMVTRTSGGVRFDYPLELTGITFDVHPDMGRPVLNSILVSFTNRLQYELFLEKTYSSEQLINYNLSHFNDAVSEKTNQ
ncbi:MAG: hypothetical protein V4616_09945 [Bacteroidota bacterium]